jgi:hypothetical protein
MNMTTLTSVAVTIEDTKELVVIEGTCNLCGDCCKPPVMRHPDFIIENTPVVNEAIYDGRCRYLTVENKCMLVLAEADGKLANYPEKLVTYWKERCKPWPTYGGLLPLSTLKAYIAEGAFENCGFVVTITPKPVRLSDKLGFKFVVTTTIKTIK